MIRSAKLLILGIMVAIFSSSAVLADAVVNSFNIQGNLQPGWVVSLSKQYDHTVVASSAKDPGSMYGVVIDPSAAPLTVQKPNEQAFVATDGNYPALVSNQNGAIKVGDYLTISATAGVADKAGKNDQYIIGKALENFNGGNSTIVYANDGSAIGRISIQLLPGKNPQFADSSNVPQPLKQLSESIAGKQVSVLRIYLALVVFIIIVMVAGVLLWSGIRSSLIAIGRNPLSRHSIMRGLSQVLVAGILVLVIGLFGVYLLLKV